MTYGPTNYGSFYEGPVTGGEAQRKPESVPEPVAGGPGAKLLAGTSPNQKVLTILGAVAAVLALFVVVGSCLSWQSITIRESGNAFVGDSIQGSVTGLTQVSTRIDVEGNTPKQRRDTEQAFREELKANTDSAVGGWTLGFGIVALLAAVPLILRRYQGIGALVASVSGLAASICAIVFFSQTGAGVLSPSYIDDVYSQFDDTSNAWVDISNGYGLWIVLFAAILLLATAVASAILVATAKAGGIGNPFTEGEQSSVQFFAQSNVGFGSPQSGFPPPFPFGGVPLQPAPGQGGDFGQVGPGDYSQPGFTQQGYPHEGFAPAEFAPLDGPNDAAGADGSLDATTAYSTDADASSQTRYLATPDEQDKPQQ